MQLPLAVVAAVAITSAVAGLDIFSYNPIECAWYGGCANPDTIQCPNGTKKVHGFSTDGMDIDASLRLTNRVHYYAPGFGSSCGDMGKKIFCCKDPPSDQTRIRTRDRVPVVNCAWAGYTKHYTEGYACEDGDCPDGYEELARTDGRSAEDAIRFGYPTHFEHTPLGFERPCDKGTRAFCCPTTLQYIDPPIDNAVKYANPLTCAWLPYSPRWKCMKISTCPPGYMLLYRSGTGRNVDPPLNLDSPAFGDKCDKSIEDPERFDEGTKAFCCKTPLSFGHRGIAAVTCEWRGDGPSCKRGCDNTGAFVELAYTDGSYDDAVKYGYPYNKVRAKFRSLCKEPYGHRFCDKYLPIGFGDSCDWGRKSFCCPKGEATNYRAVNALVVY